MLLRSSSKKHPTEPQQTALHQLRIITPLSNKPIRGKVRP